MIRTFSLLVLFVFSLTFGKAQNAFLSYFMEGVKCYEKNDFNGASAKFSKAIGNQEQAKNNYQVADAYLYRGYSRCKLKKYKSAIADMDEAIKLKPEYIKCYNFKTLVLQQEKKYEECIVWCNIGLQKKNNDPDLLLNKSNAYFALKKYKESLTPLFLILEDDPKSIVALRYIGSTYLHQKLWDSAIVYFSKAIEIDPLDFASYYDRGISKSYTTDEAGATDDIKKAMQLDTSTKFIGYNNLGFYLELEKKNFKEALGYFNKAIELDPDFAYAYSNRGLAKLNLNDIKGAFNDIRKSIELDNTNPYAFKHLGLIYLKEGQKNRACENFKKALELGYSESYDDEVEKLLKENCN